MHNTTLESSMENINIIGTDDTPEIAFDALNTTLNIKGNSYPENTFEFYNPILDWVKDYLEQTDHRQLTVNINLLYINSSSSKVLFNFFNLLEGFVGKGKEITVNWHYETDDIDSFEEGEDFKMMTEDLQFNIVELKG